VEAADLIRAAIEQTYEPYTVEEVVAEIEKGHATLFAGETSVMVCTMHRHNDEMSGHVWLAGGDLEELRDVLRPQAEEWARANGAAYATIDGRRGWVRTLKEHGFEEVSVTVRKML
jgi:hypothetical protein